MTIRSLVTGATGLVGSHVAEALVQQGHKVVALVRGGADVEPLRQLGVELTFGDLNDAAAVNNAAQHANLIVHCAAKVGDWGPVAEYRRVNVDGLRSLLEACPSDLQRFVLISSLGVYAARDHHGTDET